MPALRQIVSRIGRENSTLPPNDEPDILQHSERSDLLPCATRASEKAWRTTSNASVFDGSAARSDQIRWKSLCLTEIAEPPFVPHRGSTPSEGAVGRTCDD
jgi:hypothetical protein